MHVVSLEVTDFRNYTRAAAEFQAGCSILVGANGQGKTNLVEAIGYAATLGSHRVASDAPLIRRGADQAIIKAVVRRGERTAALDLVLSSAGRGTRARINGSPLPRARASLGLLRAVTFAPEDLALVKGDPSERRRFLDDLLVQRQPRWASVIADCEKVLRQRGALLRGVAKRGGRPDGSDSATLEVWDEQLARIGGQLWSGRLQLVASITEPFAAAYRALAGDAAGCGLAYRSSALEEVGADCPAEADPRDLERVLGEALRRRSAEEFRRGVNLTGPQRDELDITLHDYQAKGYASHGESWSLALGLRLASYRLLAGEAVDDGDPVLILDDVFAELDAKRRERLAGAIAGAEQVIITAAVAEDVPAGLTGRHFLVRGGTIEPAAA